MELPAVRRTQHIAISKHFFNSLCHIATMVTYMVNNNNNKWNNLPDYVHVQGSNNVNGHGDIIQDWFNEQEQETSSE